MEGSTLVPAYDVFREGVRASLPEIDEISDPELRDKVEGAWAMALAETEFASIDEVRPSGNPDTPAMKSGTQADHLRGVTRMAVALADSLETVVPGLGVNRDILLACGLCHDLGKPFEFSPANQTRWRQDPAVSGFPALRHPVYGAHIAITIGLPEAVCHAAAGHSGEGELVVRSLENTIVHHADHAYWRILASAGKLET
ncbi:MAG: HD domain-containing protein [Chloroflexota bacterium]|jgi:putative nucleotidyltransferase with HDIG domain|nr:HD domain-containing protein [Chloroflexota bacterium]MDP6508745.1 HD domain-containing protein [Chloroflexota bacterium]MDP6758651.1 HD domain-containing protein [Chloroflexota bacterium]